jgi:L-tyrosine isonitrile synthase
MASVYAQEMVNHKARRNQTVKKTTPRDVVAAFNTWQFKREQPDNLDHLITTTAHAVDLGLPVPFVLYWGKGRRDSVNEPELQCLDYLTKLTDKVFEIYPSGAAITLILTDTHAELNGYSQHSIAQYFSAIEHVARRRGITTTRLSSITPSQSEQSLLDHAEPICPKLLSELIRSAEKWYRGGGSPAQGATAYYRANMVERTAVQQAYPKAIFITFNGRSHRFLLPERLPIFYMYSIRKGVAVKPWFIDVSETDV